VEFEVWRGVVVRGLVRPLWSFGASFASFFDKV